MSEFPSLPLFTDAYLADTRHLSTLEHGAYLLLLMMAWRQSDCRLPNDDDTLARWAGVDARTWKRIKPRVMAFWTLAEDQWSQTRLSKEREYVSKRAEVARKNGKQGGRPKSLETSGSENPAGSARDSKPKAPNPNPNPTVIEPIAQRTVPAAPRTKWDELQDQLLAAAGLAGFRDERNPKLANLAPIRGLMEQGYSLEADILPAIRDKAAEGVVMQSWAYIVPVVVERAAAKKSIPPKPIPQQEDWHKRMAVWNESQTWAPAWGPKPNEPGCKAPAELLRAA